MSPRDVKNYVCGKLHLNSAAEYSENHDEMVNVANLLLDELYGHISWKNLGYFGDYATLDLTGSIRIYTIPTYILNKIKKIDVKLGGSGEYTWKPLTIKDINDIPDFVFEESWITNNYSNQHPVGFIHGNSLYILSGTVPAESPGIRFWFLDFPDNIDTMENTTELSIIKTVNTPEGGTMEVGLPRQFHPLLCRALIIDYKEANEIPLVGKELNYEIDLKRKLDELSPLSTSESFQASIPEDDGSDY